MVLFLLIAVGLIRSVHAERFSPVYPSDSEVSRRGESPITVIGWGPAGLMAYSMETSNVWAPSHGERYVLFNLTDDAIVWETSYELFSEDEREPGVAAAKRLRCTDALQREMQQRGMRNQNSFMEEFPYETKGKPLTVWLDVRNATSESVYCTTGHSYEYTLFAGTGAGTKPLATGRMSMVIQQRIIGYYRHPGEDRIAVLVSTYHAGIECEHHMSYAVYGCHTKAGFR